MKLIFYINYISIKNDGNIVKARVKGISFVILPQVSLGQ